eukprot:TRINITY_DN701_c0_g1_i2.p1 TRINITY_DN701_c0_g1~~TRINITY_DN701_c0_g1_i2.p1  ORF type:complete len:824 (+),score=159.61 TRINITY_DN701_c0_g1_i2:70-2472(+)
MATDVAGAQGYCAQSEEPAPATEPTRTRSKQQHPLTVGTELEYFNKADGYWLPATVKAIDAELGAVLLDCRPTHWITLKTEGSLLRRRTPPNKEKLPEVLDMFYSGTLPERVEPFFRRHCRHFASDATHSRSAQKDELAVLFEDVPGLAADLDELLGITGSISSLRAHFGPTRAKLYMDAFLEICWVLVLQLKDKHCHLFAKQEAVKRGSRTSVHDDFDIGETLGQGAFGSVALALHRKSGERRAIKTIAKITSDSEDDMQQQHRAALAREIKHLQLLDHPHVMRLYGHYEDNTHLYLVTEFCSGGTLAQMTLKFRYLGDCKLPVPFVAKVMRQVLSGIAHVHSHGILHLDLKGDNIMLLSGVSGTVLPGSKANDEAEPSFADTLLRPHAVIIDLGESQIFRLGDFQTDKLCGTPPFMAPEVWSGMMTPQADIFSLGVVLFELFSNRLPFDIPEQRRIALAFWSLKPSANWQSLGSVPSAGVFLCKMMLQQDRRQRPSAKGCLNHQFLYALREKFFMQTEGGNLPSADNTHDVPMLPKHYAERLANYAGRYLLDKAVRIHLASSWSPNCMPLMKQLFDALDVSGLGRLDVDVLRAVLEKSGIDTKRAQAAFESSVWSPEGFIGWTEFVAAAVDLGEDRFLPYLQNIFAEADTDADGLLNDLDLARIMRLDPGDDTDQLVAQQALREVIGRKPDDVSRADWHAFRLCFKTKHGEADPDVKAEPAVVERASFVFQRRPELNPTLLEQVHAMFEWFVQSPAEKADEDKLDQLAEMGFHDRKRCAVALQRHRNTITDSLVQELI